MALQTGQGAKFFIGPANQEADDKTAYEALSYTEVGSVEDVGEFGDQWNNATFTGLADSRVQKFKTVKDAGDPTLTIGFDAGNAGQTALNTAFDSRLDHAIKITLDDDPDDGANSAPTTFYFRAKIMSKRLTGIENENVIRRNITLGINSDVLELPALEHAD